MNSSKEKLAAYGRKGYGLALKAGIIYAVCVFLGLVFGGGAGFWMADYFTLGGFLTTLVVLVGIALGGAGGFIMGQVVIVGLVQDMILETGIKTGLRGLKALKDRKNPQKDE